MDLRHPSRPRYIVQPRPLRFCATRCAPTATITIAPPINVGTPIASPNTNQTHIGANGASNAPINAVSIGGNNRAPNENNANPTAEFTNPKPAIKTMSCPLANNGPANGKATAALNSADIQAAGMIGIARSIRLMIIIIAKTNVIQNDK